MGALSCSRSSLFAALVAALTVTASAGCAHYTAEVPGVLDLRSDGAGAPVDKARAAGKKREGVDGFLKGQGAWRQGEAVVVEDRAQSVLLLSLVTGKSPYFNESCRPELLAATGPGALRDVQLGHGQTLYDYVIQFVGGTVVSFIPIPVLPGIFLGPSSWTFTAQGTPVETPRSAAAGGEQ